MKSYKQMQNLLYFKQNLYNISRARKKSDVMDKNLHFLFAFCMNWKNLWTEFRIKNHASQLFMRE